MESDDCTEPLGSVGSSVVENYWRSPREGCQRRWNMAELSLPNEKIQDIARVCHEANRAYCVTLGDVSQTSWEFAPAWQKSSCIDGVNFVLKYPHAPNSASHENWLATKKKDGWSYGQVKDVAAKKHPCCVPYERLPEEQKRKDAIFRAVVLSMTLPL